MAKQDLQNGIEDIVNLLNDLPNDQVKIIDRLDTITELLQRIAVAMETRELREAGLPKHADLLQKGRVS